MTRGNAPSFVKKALEKKSSTKPSPKKTSSKPVYKENTFGNYISNENDEEGWFQGGHRVSEQKDVKSVESSENNDRVESFSNLKTFGPLDKRFVENNTTENDKTLPSTRRTNLSTFQIHSDEYRLRTLSQVTDRLDPLEEIYTRQKGCLNLMHSLQSISFKRINSAFQTMKRALFNSKEINFDTSKKSKGRFLTLLQKDAESVENNSLLGGFLKLNNMVTALKLSRNRNKQWGFSNIKIHSKTQPIPHRVNIHFFFIDFK